MSKFYPIFTRTTAKEETIAYVCLENDISAHYLNIEITNIHDFTYIFKINSEIKFINSTFQANQLTDFDRNSIVSIFENIGKIKNELQAGSFNNEFLELDVNKPSIILKFEKFKYFIPLTTPSVKAELRIIKQVYTNLETFANVGSEVIDLLHIQILNKNLIINKLLNSYYLKLNNTNSTSKNATDLYKCKEIRDLFLNKQIFKFMDSSSHQTIKNYNRSTPMRSSLFTNNGKLIWDKVFQPLNKLDDLETNDVPVSEEIIKSNVTEPDAETATETETETETTNSTSIPVKRKLQGLLRRQKRQSLN